MYRARWEHTVDKQVKMSQFSLKVESFSPPSLPDYTDVPVSALKPLSNNIASATSPMTFTMSLGPRGLYPATHLQLCYVFEGTGSIFPPEPITAGDLVKIGDYYEATVLPKNIVRSKVNEGESSTGKVVVYAWKGEKLLGSWEVGTIEGLGLEGYKSTDLARRRVEQWKKANQ